MSPGSDIQAVRRALRGIAHAAFRPLFHVREPTGCTLLANTRFHDDLLELEAYYLIARDYWKIGSIERFQSSQA